MLLIGLTGGIASGKTLVSDTFALLGVTIVDADVLARIAVEPDSAGLTQLQREFGDGIITSNGELDRPALRTLIFQDAQNRKTVDGILHPIIRSLSEEQINAAAEKGEPYVIYAVPLLVETSQQARFDRILVIDVPVSTQLERIISRDGSTKEQAQAIIDAQASREERLAIADDVINNNAGPEAVRPQVEQLHASYLELAQD